MNYFASGTTHGPGGFTGETNLISGRRSLARARAAEAGEVVELDRDALLALVQTDAELGEILNGTKRVESGATTVFKSLGMAVEDVAAAKLVYHAASQDGDGLPSGR